MSNGIKESTEYLHIVAQGIPEDVAWGAVWTDRVYNYLIRKGIPGAQAYAQATAALTANGFDLDAMAPEDVIDAVLSVSRRAQEQFATLDPTQPAASFFLQRRAGDQRKPS